MNDVEQIYDQLKALEARLFYAESQLAIVRRFLVGIGGVTEAARRDVQSAYNRAVEDGVIGNEK